MARSCCPILLPAILFLLASAPAELHADDEAPAQLDIVERTGEHLVQLDVSVRRKGGDDETEIPRLTREDFELELGGRIVPLQFADRVCQTGAMADPETKKVTVAPPSDPESREIRPAVGAPTYVFYFEHKHLTMAGQQHALVMARQMIPQLIRDGSRGMVISYGQKLVQSELTDDTGELVDYVEQLEKRPSQWTEYAYAESVMEFEPQPWPYERAERCVQIRDLIREGRIGSGNYEYRVQVSDTSEPQDGPLARAVHRFTALGSGDLDTTAANPVAD